MLKGISPLIAAVLLIAITMALAGVMASWATQFSVSRLTKTDQETNCIGALDLSSLKFDNGTVTLKIRNIGDINLTNMKANLEYGDATKNKLDIKLKDYNVTDPLNPASTTFFIYSTGTTDKPDKIEVYSENCKSYPVPLLFK
jgi:flagellin-like protein